MKKKEKKKENKELPGYPDYPDSDDMFQKGIKEGKLNPDDPSSKKAAEYGSGCFK